MLQEIEPHRMYNEYLPRAAEEDDIVFAFSEKGAKSLLRVFDDTGRLLDRPVTDSYPVIPKIVFPRVFDYQQNAPERIAGLRYLFRVDETAVFLDTAEGEPSIPGFTWLTNRLFRRGLPQEFSFAGATAWHLAAWYRTTRFCGRCGTPTQPDKRERALRCPVCGFVSYPRINPAVIIGVTNGDRIILSRYADGHQSSTYNTGARTYKGRSLVAGYCEIGETVEETVRREVMEEVGLKVRNITYYKSQPWGFDGALLFGFYCQVDGDDTIRRDPSELAEAAWCRRQDIGELIGVTSLTNEMIAKFRDGEVF